MGRPRTPIGTFGEISFIKVAGGQVQGRTRFRDDDGQVRRVSATGASRKEAERNLKKVLAQRASHVASGEITADSSFAKLVAVWLADLDLENKLAPSTRALYERNMRQLVMHALQCRHDERQVKTPAAVARPVITLAAASGVASLLDWPMERWVEFFDANHAARHGQNGQVAFLRYAYRCLEDLLCGSGWEAEFPRDVWELRRLGLEGRRRLRFDGIPQTWLRELAKRFARWRLSIGRSPNQVYIDTRAIARFARFVAPPQVGVTSLANITRSMLERYLADLATDPRALRSRSRDISSLGAFLDAIRRHEWDHSLPASATFYPDDFPKPEKRLPRGLAEHVMAQLEQPDNLDRWHNPESRLLTVILMRCGLRIGDACKVAFDCVVRDGDGAAYLRYVNRKMKREALVPIDEEVEHAIAAQQKRILQRWPEISPWLFPAPRMNPDGRKPLSTHSYRGQLRDWLSRCDVRDEHGRPAHLTPPTNGGTRSAQD